MTVLSLRLPPNMSPEQAEVQMNKQLDYHAKNPPAKGRVVGLRSVTWMGHPAKELRVEAPEDAKRDPYGAAFTRYVVTSTHQFIAVIDTPDRRKLSSSTINGFFDNIQPIGK